MRRIYLTSHQIIGHIVQQERTGVITNNLPFFFLGCEWYY